MWCTNVTHTAHSFIPLAYTDCDNSLPFTGLSSIPLCYIPFPSTLFHQLVFHHPSLHLAIYFLVYLSATLFPNSYIILFWGFSFLPLSVHVQTNIIYLTLLSIFLYWYQLDTQFLYKLHKIKFLYMFRASSAHLQEVNDVNCTCMQPLVFSFSAGRILLVISIWFILWCTDPWT